MKVWIVMSNLNENRIIGYVPLPDGRSIPVTDALEYCHNRSATSKNLADAICGSHAPKQELIGDHPSPVANGVLETLDQIVGNLRVHLTRMDVALHRLEDVV
jgi:hypothetical protein